MQTDALDIRIAETGERGRYFARMPDGLEAELTFVRTGPAHLIADRTFVPPAWRGRGIAERLVERLVADARSGGARITPACWFVADEFARHGKDWEDVLKR